jgi:glycosyltransferase involved in cell wall biosynthesis
LENLLGQHPDTDMVAENGLSRNTLNPSTDMSIVVPFYRGEKFFPRLAESIVASYLASACKLVVELIVIVDSVESDVGQISSMLNQHTGVSHNIFTKVVKNDCNLGVARSRMTGQQLSSGKFITFIDQDDYVGASYFSVLEQQLTGDFDFFLLNGYIEFEKQKIHRPVFYYHAKLTFNQLARVNFLITPGLLVFNNSRVRCEFRQMSVKHPGSDDWACYLELLSNPTLKYKYIRERLIHYVVHNTNYHQDKTNFIISQIRTIQYFQRKYPRNTAIKIKIASLQFRLKRHLSLIKLSALTMSDVAGFLVFIWIELFSVHNLIWLIWRKRLAIHDHHKA